MAGLTRPSPAEQSGDSGRGIAGSDTHIHHRDSAAGDCIDRCTECISQLRAFGHWAESLSALRASQLRQVDLRVADPLADPAVLDRSVAHARHALLVQLVIEE